MIVESTDLEHDKEEHMKRKLKCHWSAIWHTIAATVTMWCTGRQIYDCGIIEAYGRYYSMSMYYEELMESCLED